MAESKNIQSDLIPKIATGFCSGIARTCDICGAVTGGVMALGLCLGRNEKRQSRDPIYSAIRKMKKEFEARFGSSNCKELTGCDLGTKEGQAFFKKQNRIKQCREYTEEATRITMTLLETDDESA